MNLKQCICNLSAALHRLEEPDVLFQRLVDELAQVFLADRCALWRLEAKQFGLMAVGGAAHADPPMRKGPGELSNLSLSGWSEGYQRLGQNQMLQVCSRSQSKPLAPTLPPELAACEGFLGVPILAGSELVGLLGLIQFEAPLACKPVQLNSLRQLAELLGIAFIQARLSRQAQMAEVAAASAQAVAEELHTTLEEMQLAEAALQGQNQKLVRSGETLKAEHQCYQSLFESAPDAYLVTDEMGVIQAANHAAAALLHVSVQHLAGKPLVLFVAEPERRGFHTKLTQLQHQQQQIWNTHLKPRGSPTFAAELSVERLKGQSQRKLWLLRALPHPTQTEAEAGAEPRSSEVKFQLAIEHAPDVFVIYDPQGRFLFVNAQGLRLSGKSPEELLGHTDQEVFPPEVTAGYIPLLQQAIATRTPQIGECSFTLPGQALRTIVVKYVPLLDPQGEIQQIFGITYDITVRKQAETALWESQRFMQRILDTTPNIVYVYDLIQQRSPYVSGRLTEISGYSVQEIQAMSGSLLDQLIHPEDLAQVRAHHERFRTAQEGQVLEIEYRMRQASGEWRYLHSRDTLFERTAEGLPWQILGVARDITEQRQAEEAMLRAKIAEAINRKLEREIAERKQAEQAWRASEARYRAIVEDQTELIQRILPDGTITFVTSAICRHFGLQPQQRIGRSLFELVPQADRERLRQHLACLSRDKPVAIIEEQHLATSGELRWVEWTDRAICDDQGQIIEIQSVGRDITERKQAEQALRISEARYRTVVEHQTELICRTLPNGTVTFVNSAIHHRFDSKIGLNLFELSVDPERLRQHLASLTPDQPVATIEEQEYTIEGELRWLEWTDQAIFDEQGQLIEYQSVGRDITERKQAERALRISEARYRTVVEHQTDLIQRTLPDGTITFVNPANCRYFGFLPETRIGLNVFDSVPEPERLRQHLASLSPDKPVATIEEQEQDAKGELRWLEWTDQAVFDEQGQVIEYQSVGRDITERKQAEQALEQTNRTLRSLIEASPLPIVFLDPQGMVKLWNPAAERVFGWRADAVLGQFLPIVPHRRREFLDNLQQILAGQPLSEFEAPYRCKDGQMVDMCVWAIRIDDVEGKPGCLVISTDITERKQAEALERANRDLQQTNANLSRLAQFKSELVATVSHELRMPITTVCTGISALKKLAPALNPKADRALTLADHEAQRLARLVNSLLDFSKLDSGTYRWQEETVDLNAVLARAVQATAILFETRRIQLHCALTNPSPQVLGDCERLVQLVVNLLDNAAKFSPVQGQVWLELSRQGRTGVITVRDQGPGIAAENQANIFELFGQIQEPSGRRPQGIGLGLYLCRQIAQHHGGSLTVESQPGQGSTFQLVLPLQMEPPQQP